MHAAAMLVQPRHHLTIFLQPDAHRTTVVIAAPQVLRGKERGRGGVVPEGLPVKVFGHLTQPLAKREGQVIIADQLLNSVLPQTHSLQAGQGL